MCVLHVLGAALGEEPRDPLTDVGAGRGVARAVRSGRGRVHVASAAGVTPPPPLPARGAATLVNRTGLAFQVVGESVDLENIFESPKLTGPVLLVSSWLIFTGGNIESK